MEEKVSVIIAAKNEAPRIDRVLHIACDHPLVDEVIVVNDGSTDDTAKVCEKCAAKIITNKVCQGKTLSIKEGLKAAKNEVVVLLDADLKGLTHKNIDDLARPVLDKKVDFTLSIRGNSSMIYKIFHMDFVSGERAIRKSIMSDPEIWSKPKIGYGLEVLMNNSFLTRKKRFISVYLPNLYATPKSEKMSYWRGYLADLTMVFNIFRAFPILLVGLQFVEMVYLNHKYHKELNIREQHVDIKRTDS